MSHTPGPWLVSKDMRGLGNVPVAGVEISTGFPIANCGTHGEANARLIAAAPDLLWLAERSESLRNHTVAWTKAELDRSWAEWNQKYIAAIVKITGGAKS